jgi:uncharacterized coiled-coil protein SlyX
MSFLDIISCAFGAIILLFVLSKQAEPMVIEGIRANLEGVIAELERTIYELRGNVTVLNREKSAKRVDLNRDQAELEGLLRELKAVQGEHAAARQTLEAKLVIEGKLSVARQDMTEEMQRLLGESHRRPEDDSNIGGVKGIQVMNDMGDYMFSAYAGRWIPDTPARRQAILKRLRTWNPFSNSSPVEGITRAIRTFYAPDKKISLYVFGDEFSGPSIDAVVRQVDAINKEDAEGNRLVRIHGVGFPVQMTRARQYQQTGIRFAALMRILSERNGGTRGTAGPSSPSTPPRPAARRSPAGFHL